MPLPGTKVIHRDFSTHHMPTAEGTMTSTCTITRASATVGTMNDTTGDVTITAGVTIATDIVCRVQAEPASMRTQPSGGQEVTQRLYAVSVPADTALVLVDDRVTITTAVDPLLVGRVLRVVDVQYGSEGWQNDLVCKDDLG